MMVNIGTRVEPVNRVFFSSRSVALIERKMLRNTTLSIEFHQYTLSKIKTQVFTMSDVLDCVSIHCADEKQHSNLDFLTKSVKNTLQTHVDIANEYLQALKTGKGVKSYAFCSLHQCKCACYPMFLITFLLSN